MTAHEKTRLKTQFAILLNAHMQVKVKPLFHFLLKSNLSNDSKMKSVSNNAALFSKLFSYFLSVSKVTSKPGLLIRHVVTISIHDTNTFLILL